MMESEALTPSEVRRWREVRRWLADGWIRTPTVDTRRLTEGEMAATLAALAEFRREYPGSRGQVMADGRAVVDLGTLIECATIARQTLAHGTHDRPAT